LLRHRRSLPGRFSLYERLQLLIASAFADKLEVASDNVSPSPLIGLWVSLAAQSPTMPGMALCSAANPRMNVNDTG
jgi:hypothetical protein